MDEKIMAAWAAVKAKVYGAYVILRDFLSHNKMIFFVLIPLFLLAKFRDIASSYLTWKTEKDINKDKKENDVLETEVKAANTEADALVKHAEETAANTGKVDENWDKK